MDDVRELIEARLRELDLKRRDVSRKIGKNDAYIQQFLERGTPKALPEDARKKLARILKVPEPKLMPPGIARLQHLTPGPGDDPGADSMPTVEEMTRAEGKRGLAERSITIPEYDVRASMGGGFHIDVETVRGHWPFDRSYIVNELRLNPGNLVVIEVIGDSMEPTLRSGDRVLVDMSDQRVGIPGVFVLFDGDGTVAKRVEKIPDSEPGKVRLISDNQHHGSYEVLGEHVNIVGRVVWFARRM